MKPLIIIHNDLAVFLGEKPPGGGFIQKKKTTKQMGMNHARRGIGCVGCGNFTMIQILCNVHGKHQESAFRKQRTVAVEGGKILAEHTEACSGPYFVRSYSLHDL
jgi:pyruvate/2-oxoacid:ferredoxin oxidoreductase beta subunit